MRLKDFLLYQPAADPAKQLEVLKAQAAAFALSTGGKVTGWQPRSAS